MIKSASGNISGENASKTKQQFTAVFLVLQAILLICILIYFHESAGLDVLGALLVWALASLGLAAAQVRFQFIPEDISPLSAENESPGQAHIFGLPSKNLDMASIFAMMQEGAALLKNGHIIYINPSLAYVLAAQEEEVLGTRMGSYLHPEDVSLINIDGRGTPGMGPSRATLRLTTRLGDVRWVICSVHNIDWQGEDAVLLLFENIGPLRQAQQALEEQEYQSRILLERTPLGIAMFDSMGQLRLSNTAWHSIWSSIVGSGARRFNILQDPFLPNTAVERAVRQAFNKKDAGISNFEHAAPWGETRWLNLSFHPMSDPMGKLIGVAMIQQDITDQIRSVRRENELNDQLTSLRHELSYHEAFMGQMQDKAKYVIINFETDGTISAWNSYAEMRFGLPRDRAIGMNYKRLKVDFSPYVPLLQEVLAKKKPCSVDRFERFDASGLHYEKILVYIVQMGFKNIIFLEIKDITHHIFDKTMRAILGRLAALSGMGRNFSKLLDFDSTPLALKQDEGHSAILQDMLETSTFLQSIEAESPKLEKIRFEASLDAALEKLTAQYPKLVSTKDYSDPELEIVNDPALLCEGFAALGKALMDLDFEGSAASLRLAQKKDRFYAIVNISAPAKDNIGITDLSALLSRLEDGDALVEGSPLKSIISPLQILAACGGIVGGYASEQECGFTCRFRLPGSENPLVENPQ